MKCCFLKGKLARTFYFLAVAALPIPSALAQSATAAKLLVTSPVVATQTVTLAGNLRPEANAQNDRGAVADGLKLNHMLLQLKRPEDRQTALNERIQAIHEPSNPAFHHWLTAKEYGKEYGPNPADIAEVPKV